MKKIQMSERCADSLQKATRFYGKLKDARAEAMRQNRLFKEERIEAVRVESRSTKRLFGYIVIIPEYCSKIIEY